MPNHAFVLIDAMEPPAPDAVLNAYASLDAELEGGKPPLQPAPDDEGDGDTPDEPSGVSAWTLGGESLFVALMPAPIPEGEAEHHAGGSLKGLGGSWTPRPHTAHLLVTLLKAELTTSELHAFTLAVAAVAQASNAVGVYWGNGRVTHPTDFFAECAAHAPLIAWNGISIADEGNGRMSLLSLGMAQVGLPDLLVECDAAEGSSALEFLLDTLGYVLDRGEPIAHGETVGRTTDERLPVRHRDSPADPEQPCMAIAFPAAATRKRRWPFGKR